MADIPEPIGQHFQHVSEEPPGRITGIGVAECPDGFVIVRDDIAPPVALMLLTYQCGPHCFLDHPNEHKTLPGLVDLETVAVIIANLLEQADRDGYMVPLMAEVDRRRQECRDQWRQINGGGRA